MIGIDRIPELVELSKANLAKDGFRVTSDGTGRAEGNTIMVLQGDGWIGYLPSAPFHAIMVGAAAITVPHALVDQLALGGKSLFCTPA